MISAIPGCHLVTSPVFGRPPAADKAQLLLAVAGDRWAKTRVIEMLVPAAARRAFDMGENVEKGAPLRPPLQQGKGPLIVRLNSIDDEVDRKRHAFGVHGGEAAVSRIV